MKYHQVVIFLDKNARIIQTDDLSAFRNIPGVLIDPDLSLVSGHPPHYWKNDKGKVVPITNEEKIVRDAMWKELAWGHKELEGVFLRAKRELRNRQILYAGIGSLLFLLPVLMFLWLR